MLVKKKRVMQMHNLYFVPQLTFNENGNVMIDIHKNLDGEIKYE